MQQLNPQTQPQLLPVVPPVQHVVQQLLKPPVQHPGYVAAAQVAANSAAHNQVMNHVNQMAQVHATAGMMHQSDFTTDASGRKKKKTGGRKHGSQGYNKQDVKQLLDLIDAHKPVDREGWESINIGYNRYAQQSERQEREPENLKKKFMSLVNYKPVGDQEVPEDVRRAKKIHHTIEPQAIGEEEDARLRKRKLPDSTIDLTSRGWTTGSPSKEQIKHLLTQLASQQQQQQSQQQQHSQQLAQQLSMQLMQQQQHHKAFMVGMASSLVMGSRQLPGLNGLSLPSAAALTGDWSTAAAAAANAAATAAAVSLTTVTLDEWARTVNSEGLAAKMKGICARLGIVYYRRPEAK